MNPINTYYAYKLLNILVSDWDDLDAYKNGFIDEKGNAIKPIEKLSNQEKQSYPYFDRIAINIKRIVSKIPLVRSKLGSYITALYLLKEDASEKQIILEDFIEYMDKNFSHLLEDIANTSGGDNVSMVPIPHGTFAGCTVFRVNGTTYDKCRHGKHPNHRWARYVDMEESLGLDIKSYAQKNPKQQILLQDEKTGGYIRLRRS